jgi:hypothetical protein
MHLSTIAAAATTVTALAWMLSFGSARTSGLYVERPAGPPAAYAAPAAPTATSARAARPEGGQLMDLVREATWPTRLRPEPAADAAPNPESNNG